MNGFPPSLITLPRRLCTVCRQYRSTMAGCQNSSRVPGNRIARPFICAGCMVSRRA